LTFGPALLARGSIIFLSARTGGRVNGWSFYAVVLRIPTRPDYGELFKIGRLAPAAVISPPIGSFSVGLPGSLARAGSLNIFSDPITGVNA
jgi:hypothetical protein